MTTKRQDNLFGLTHPIAADNTSVSLYRPGLSTNGKPTREETWIATESQKQLLVIEGQRIKTAVGMAAIDDIRQQADNAFSEIALHSAAVIRSAQGSGVESYIQQFCERNMQMGAQDVLGVAEIGARTIAGEVARPLYPPVFEEPKRGLMKRLFGD